MNRNVVSVLFLIPLTGCWGGYSIRNIDKPRPPAYEIWHKPGADTLKTKKTLLECGEPTISGSSFAYERYLGLYTTDEQIAYSFMVTACMEQAGFVARWGGLKESCALYPRYMSFPACQPGAVIPKPSVERRLNSWHCKLELDYDYCLKHAVRPSLCRPDDFMHPPPECRP